jgi:hypothetical protein
MTNPDPHPKCVNGHSMSPENTGARDRCKQCARNNAARWRQAHPEKVKEHSRLGYAKRKIQIPNRDRVRHLKAKGITEADFDAMYTAQNGSCAICETQLRRRALDPTGVKRMVDTAHVDHNHETGAVRGLLCMRCNSAIGYLQDNPSRARKLATYLETNDV